MMTKGLGLSVEQEARLEQIQARRPKRWRGHGVPPWASIDDVEQYVRLTSERTKTVYIFKVVGGYDWTMIEPTEHYSLDGTLVKTITLEPEPRAEWWEGAR